MPLADRRQEAGISGSTLLVYLYIFKKGNACGVREVQRALGFSSSSSAHYHLEKLMLKGVLTRDSYGNYKINKNKKVWLINPFFVVNRFVFLKQLVYATATTLMCLFFLIFFWNFLTLTVILALLPGVLACGIFWYDTIKLWSSLPSLKKNRSRVSQECSDV